MLWMLLAASTPTYLSCTLGRGSDQERVEINASEADASATVVQPTASRTVRRAAVFSPTDVRIPDAEITWIVDRVTLKLKQVVAFGTYRNEHEGQCEVKPAPAKRAF